MGDECTKSNGNIEGREESMNLVKNIKSLKKYFQSYKVDNERLKSKEKKDGFNIKLIQRLDII